MFWIFVSIHQQSDILPIMINRFILVGAGFIYWAVGWAFAYGDSETNPASRFIGVKGRDSRTIYDLSRI